MEIKSWQKWKQRKKIWSYCYISYLYYHSHYRLLLYCSHPTKYIMAWIYNFYNCLSHLHYM